MTRIAAELTLTSRAITGPARTSLPRLLVIADDLTGAADTGVQFGKRGIPSLLTLEPISQWRQLTAACEALIVNTDSRHLEPHVAATRVHDLVTWAQQVGIPHLYKKVDSTLRGNVGCELEACLLASGARTLPVVPAFPALGRTTRSGRLYVGGRALAETGLSSDPLEPAHVSEIAAVIRAQTALPITVAAPAMLYSDEAAPEGIVIIDAETDGEVARIGRWLARRHLLGVAAGSGGLAATLPDALDLRRAAEEPRPHLERMLVVCGSVSDVALDQCARAVAGGMPAVRVPPDLLLAEPAASSPRADELIDVVVACERRAEHVLLRTAEDRRDVEACLARGARAGLDARQVCRRVAERMAALAGRVLELAGFDLVVVIGGDTLAALARVQRWRGLRPLLELAPGVPLCATLGGGRPSFVASKAGAFGPPDILARL